MAAAKFSRPAIAPSLSSASASSTSLSLTPPSSLPASSFSSSSSLHSVSPNARVWNFDRTTSPWAGFDSTHADLWFLEGDTLVYLNHNPRPLFRVSSHSLRESRSSSLLARLAPARQPAATKKPPARQAPTPPYELRLKVPSSSLEATHSHTLAVRNFFAWLTSRPLVGLHLGEALAGLLTKMQEFRAPECDSTEDVLVYADVAGYSNVENRPEYALAMLHFAELHQLRHVFVDAFAHCAGMNEDLAFSSEFGILSRRTKALITRAYLEMDIHVERASRTIFTFAEEEMSPKFLGLSRSARDHLDLFRSTLQTFYVSRNGYWPPVGGAFQKSILRSLYADFSGLYDYLADKRRDDNNALAEGGLCVLQNLRAFDQRHSYAALPHPFPLLPRTADSEALPSQRGFKQLRLAGKARSGSNEESLGDATNSADPRTRASPLVRHYREFEARHGSNLSPKLSVSDARKVRWILIYCVLQTLISVLQAPSEVRETEASAYPLCILTAGVPPWQRTSLAAAKAADSAMQSSNNSTTESFQSIASPSESDASISIQPDCETVDYFNYFNGSNTPLSSSPQVTPNEFKSRRKSLRESIRRAPLLLSRTRSRASSKNGHNSPYITPGTFSISSSDIAASPPASPGLMGPPSVADSVATSQESIPEEALHQEETPISLNAYIHDTKHARLSSGQQTFYSAVSTQSPKMGSVTQLGGDEASQKTKSIASFRLSSSSGQAQQNLYVIDDQNGKRVIRLAYRHERGESEGGDSADGRPRTAPARESVVLRASEWFHKDFWGLTVEATSQTHWADF